jgi:hypothetical protein
MLLPLPSRVIYTFMGITLPIGSFWADYNETHNLQPGLVAPRQIPRWTNLVDVRAARSDDDRFRLANVG